MTTSRGELGRKSIHVALSLVAAAVVARLLPLIAAAVLAAATMVALLVELARRLHGRFGTEFRRRLGPLLRGDEVHRLTGATTLALGFTIAAVLLPGRPALAGILFTGVADAVAAVIGRRWGRHRYRGGKSVEGSIAFFLATVALGLTAAGLPLAASLLVAALLTPVEALSLRVNDNLYLPLTGAAAVAAAIQLIAA